MAAPLTTPGPAPRSRSAARRRRVLLISPVAGVDPYCGDVVYTEHLLRHPPEGYEYETYDQAFAAGRLHELGRRADLGASAGLARVGALSRVARERAVNTLRRTGLLFREPFRHFVVDEEAYDLVHCHVFSASFRDLRIPLVVSNASLIEELYTGARGWSRRRARLASAADAWLAGVQDVQHSSLGMPRASVVVAFTDALRDQMIEHRVAAPERLCVAPAFVEPGERPVREVPRTIGFVAGDFEAKGGPQVLAAFETVRRARPDTHLLVVGSAPRLSPEALRRKGITWIPHVSRTALLDQHLPSMDVFAYPTRSDGLPLTVLEVMARGIPVVTSDYGAMPEVVGHTTAGRVVPGGSAPGLAQALLELLDPAVHAQVRRATAAWFDSRYSPGAATRSLAHAYDQALRPTRSLTDDTVEP